MTIIHLGVTDLPYTGPDSKVVARVSTRMARGNGKDKAPRGRSHSVTKTTGEVAEILEAEYGIMEFFWNRYGPKIIESFEEDMERQLEAQAVGLPSPDNIFGRALQTAESLFRDMIDRRELDGAVSGVATGAARKGVNHRLSHPYAKGNPERPSFKDTGLYQASFRAWVEGKIGE